MTGSSCQRSIPRPYGVKFGIDSPLSIFPQWELSEAAKHFPEYNGQSKCLYKEGCWSTWLSASRVNIISINTLKPLPTQGNYSLQLSDSNGNYEYHGSSKVNKFLLFEHMVIGAALFYIWKWMFCGLVLGFQFILYLNTSLLCLRL